MLMCRMLTNEINVLLWQLFVDFCVPGVEEISILITAEEYL